MTQLTVLDTRTRERSADERLYHILYVLGFMMYLPIVLARRALSGARRVEGPGNDPLRSNSMLAEVRAKVDTVLAFVFMV